MGTGINYFVEKRKQDKQKLWKMFKDNHDMDENKVAALFSLQTGYRIGTIKQMIEELREAGSI